MFTAADSVLYLPILAAFFALGGLVLYALFLFTVAECVSKVSPHNRAIKPSEVWLNLIPGVGLVWQVVTVLRVSRSLRQEFEERGRVTRDDFGRTVGLVFALGSVLSIAAGVGTPFAADALTAAVPEAREFVAVFYVGLAGLVVLTLAQGVFYWARLVRHSKELDRTGEGVFWAKYNARLEFPTSVAVAGLALSLAFGLIVWVVVVAMGNGPDKRSVPISLTEGGFDDAGSGSPGSGGVDDPLARGDTTPQKQDIESVQLPKPLPEIKQDIQTAIQAEDPTATTPLSDEKGASYGRLDESLRNKLLNLGQKKGDGPGAGAGTTGQPGTGPGGTGADGTRARSLRWVLRFRTLNGRDYLDQLQSLGAVVLVPVPPDRKQAYIFRDLARPRPGRTVSSTDPEWGQLTQQIQFCDLKRESVRGVAEALGLDFTPSEFWAFFPKGLEGEMSRLEVGYRNRRPEDIEETAFQVTVRNDKFALIVADQKAKR